MDKQEKIDVIDRKCRLAGCNEEAAKRHLQMFVYERWDVHPPADFREWVVTTHEEGETKEIDSALSEGRTPPTRTKPPNPITAWNSDPTRQEFYKSRGHEALEGSS